MLVDSIDPSREALVGGSLRCTQVSRAMVDETVDKSVSACGDLHRTKTSNDHTPAFQADGERVLHSVA
jgi:hypothetical protein